MFHVVPNWHPALVHFTVALYTTATFLYAVHIVFAKSTWGGAALTAARVNLWLGALTLLWQIYSGRRSLQIHFRQCGHRCGGSRAKSSRMAWRTAGKVG